MSTITHAVPSGPAASVDPGDVSDAACTLVELSTIPDDAALLRRAAEQLPPLMAQLRKATGIDTDTDEDWLSVWRPYGIIRERTP
ncbi:hypothetical protein [Streptomyces sp. NPDC037389]|uniref:hypothetical protein n=1 Tax=Streptomyces sp. NPDC037389 TaxID=3155369 RepID=UPI0033C40A0F